MARRRSDLRIRRLGVRVLRARHPYPQARAACAPEQPAELVGVLLGMDRRASLTSSSLTSLVGDYVLATGVPVEYTQAGLIRRSRRGAPFHLSFAQRLRTLNERFTMAVDQLGSDRPAVRLTIFNGRSTGSWETPLAMVRALIWYSHESTDRRDRSIRLSMRRFGFHFVETSQSYRVHGIWKSERSGKCHSFAVRRDVR
jgi:hypothetical protein